MFYSILFKTKEQYEQKRCIDEPDCFKDLNLNQIFDVILKNKKEFKLESLFYTPLQDKEIISYRQDIMSDLENDELRKIISKFSSSIYNIDKNMIKITEILTSNTSYENNYLTRGMLLHYAEKYCIEIYNLVDGLKENIFHSEGLNSFTEYLLNYIKSESFKEFYSHITQLRNNLSTVEYCMYIKNGTIRIRKYEGEDDYSKKILKCFGKFRQGEVKDYHKKLDEEPIATHVEAEVLNMVAGLYKDIFNDLNFFCEKYLYFIDNTISRFAYEIQFYLSWLDYILPLRQVGLPFNYPKLTDMGENLYVREGFDLALAFITRDKTVTNDFVLNTPERIIVVTGPNQGGKTTFARAFGQIHWLASLGLCIPGSEAKLYIFDNILTHFGREENLSSFNGKLQDDLIRLHDLLKKATKRSIIIVNEIFSSTTLLDALILGKRMMDAISKIGALAIVVTFLDELACHGEETVSMMSIVKESDPTERTYKIIRKPPDGLAYAMHIANKYNLTYEQICRRLKK